MLLEKLKELKRDSGMTYEEIAEASLTPESTVKRIFAGKCEPLASTMYRISKALGASLDEILAETNVVLSPKTLAEVQETAEAVETELDQKKTELEMLQAEIAVLTGKVAALTAENDILRIKIEHKDELLVLHKFYAKYKTE